MLKEINKNRKGIKDYFCAEFQLKKSRILYQFKLRKEPSGELFAVVPENSKALETLKKGDELSMRYYCRDNSTLADIRKTRIKSVDKFSGFRNHYSIGLEINSENIYDQDPFLVID